MTIYKISTKQLLELTSEFNKVIGHEVLILKTQWYFYIGAGKMENEL